MAPGGPRYVIESNVVSRFSASSSTFGCTFAVSTALALFSAAGATGGSGAGAAASFFVKRSNVGVGTGSGFSNENAGGPEGSRVDFRGERGGVFSLGSSFLSKKLNVGGLVGVATFLSNRLAVGTITGPSSFFFESNLKILEFGGVAGDSGSVFRSGK